MTVSVEGTQLKDSAHARAGWIASAVMYGVAPSLCDPPAFQGVVNRLDDLTDLGVSALWLSPINATPPGDYGYAVTDYFALRPEYGTRDEFRALVAAAHARGIRVLMDLVPNHTSDQHPWFQDAQRHGEGSPWWDFYDRDPAGQPTHYFSWTHLPNLNYANPQVRRFMLDAFAFWVRECDVDGFRIDAIWGIKERHPEWLDELVTELRRLKPDMLLIAEASARDPFYAAHGFDAAYDWTDELGRWAWAEVFAGSTPIGEAITAAITNGASGDHPASLALRFLNNNDTGPRFLTTHGPDRYRVALAMLLTLPGLPCLFPGDEVGAEYHPYEGSGPIDWSDRHGLRADVQRLIHLRQRIPALHSQTWQPLAITPAEPLFAYLRGGTDGDQVIVILNFSENELEAKVDLPPTTPLLPRTGDPGTCDAGGGEGELTDLWSGDAFSAPASDRLTVPVSAWGFRVLVPDHV